MTLQSVAQLLANTPMTVTQIAQQLCLSRMRVHQLLRTMQNEGKVRGAGVQGSQGGRPARLYEYVPEESNFVYVELEHASSYVQIRLYLLNERGDELEQGGGMFARLDANSLNQWLDSWRSRRIERIVFYGDLSVLARGTQDLLASRYACPVHHVTEVEALLTPQEGGLCLCWKQGMVPQASMRQRDGVHHIRGIAQLPMPESWESLNYEDKALLEEMVARIVQLLSCVLHPNEVTLHAECWTERLCERVRYNVSTKLGDLNMPRLVFAKWDDVQVTRACRSWGCRIPRTSGK